MRALIVVEWAASLRAEHELTFLSSLYRPELREADALQAERLVRAELRRWGWTQAELGQRRKGDPEKVRMAERLRRETTMTLKWIAVRLKMGAWTSVSNCWIQSRKQKKWKSGDSYD